MFRSGLLSLALLAGAVSASAQDASWWEIYNSATENSNNSEAMSTLKALEDKSLSAIEKSIAAYGMGLVSAENEQYGQAALHWERAHETYISQDEKNDRLYNGISMGLIQVYIAAGRDEDAERMANERNKTLSPQNEDIWSTVSDQPVHRFTGLSCPFSAGEFVRKEFKNLSPVGTDLSCHYEKFVDDFNIITLYFTKYEDGVSEKNAHKWTLELMERTVENSGAEYLEQKVKLSDDNLLTTRITESIYSFEAEDGKVLSGAWTGVFGDWVFKTRVSWDAKLGGSFGRTASIDLLRATTQSVTEHLQKCDDVEDFKYEQFDAVSEDDEMAAVLSALIGRELPSELGGEIEALKISAPRPNQECLRHYHSKDGSAFISQHYDGRRIYSIDGRNVEADVYFVPEAGLTKDGYVLESREPDGSTIVYKKYSKVPSPKDLLEDYIEFHDGRTTPLGSIEVDSDGNTQVNITMPDE